MLDADAQGLEEVEVCGCKSEAANNIRFYRVAELLQSKHQRELETVNIELQEKRHMVMRLNSEVSEATDQKLTMKSRLEEYEDKIKKDIEENKAYNMYFV